VFFKRKNKRKGEHAGVRCMIAYESEGINLIRTVGHACLLMGSLDKLHKLLVDALQKQKHMWCPVLLSSLSFPLLQETVQGEGLPYADDLNQILNA
jgi:hypothetical protein